VPHDDNAFLLKKLESLSNRIARDTVFSGELGL
jgi:hypothetical protein